MIGTAYEVACILVKVVYRVGKWLLVTPADGDPESPAGKEASGGRARRDARLAVPLAAISPSPASTSARVARVSESFAEAPLPAEGSETLPAWPAVSLGAWQRAARIVTREGPGYRVHFYFKSGEPSVRRVVMLDFQALRERFGMDHAAALRSRLGLGAKRPAGRARIPEAKWARLVLPESAVDGSSPFDLAALAMIDQTLSEVERFIGTTDLPVAAEQRDAASTVSRGKGKPKGKAKASAKDPAMLQVRSPVSGGIGGTSAPVPPASDAGSDPAAGQPVGRRVTSRRRAIQAVASDVSSDMSSENSAAGYDGRRASVRSEPGVGEEGPNERVDGAVAVSGGSASTPVPGSAAAASADVAAIDSQGEAVLSSPAADPSPAAPWDVPEDEDYGPKAFVGILLEFGLAERVALSSGRRFNSFFADLYSDGIVVRHTGADLQRALKHVDARPGDRIELIFHGSVPLTGGKLRKKLWTAHVLGRSGTSERS